MSRFSNKATNEKRKKEKGKKRNETKNDKKNNSKEKRKENNTRCDATGAGVMRREAARTGLSFQSEREQRQIQPPLFVSPSFDVVFTDGLPPHGDVLQDTGA
eukprot:m.481531 g.481531  ORF g.481531 m.481531 type:complete len:102 (-) comp22199_c0_seq1:287-592(-)